MRKWIAATMLILCVPAFAQDAPPATMRTISELDALKMENRRIRADLAALQAQVAALSARLAQLSISRSPTTQVAVTPPSAPIMATGNTQAMPSPAQIVAAMRAQTVIQGMTYDQCVTAMGQKPSKTNKSGDTVMCWWEKRTNEMVKRTSGANGSYGTMARRYKTVIVSFVVGIATKVTEDVDDYDTAGVTGSNAAK